MELGIWNLELIVPRSKVRLSVPLNLELGTWNLELNGRACKLARFMDTQTPPTIPDADLGTRLHDLETLLEISKAITAEKDLDRLLGIILGGASKLLRADRSSLFLVDEARGELYSRIAQKSEIKEIRFPMKMGLAGHVATAREILNIPDAYDDPRFNRAFDKQTGYRTKSVLCIPLVTHEDKVVGVLQVINKAGGGPFDGYDIKILNALGSQAAIVLDNAALVRHYVEKQKIRQAMEIAKQIQVGLLPKEGMSLPGFSIEGWSQACDEVGGDYYDYLDLPGGRLAVIIGDVSGHGVGSALLMATSRAFLRGLALREPEPTRILMALNDLLVRDMGGEKFMTLFCGMLDPVGGDFFYASAGHDAPIHYRAADDSFADLESTGIPLGIMEGFAFEDGARFRMGPGDQILFMTDGIWEPMNEAGVSFGKDRIKEIMRRDRGRPLRDVIQTIHRAMLEYTHGAPQKDDISMILVRRETNADGKPSLAVASTAPRSDSGQAGGDGKGPA